MLIWLGFAVEVAHMWRTIKNASGMRASEIDMINPALR